MKKSLRILATFTVLVCAVGVIIASSFVQYAGQPATRNVVREKVTSGDSSVYQTTVWKNNTSQNPASGLGPSTGEATGQGPSFEPILSPIKVDKPTVGAGETFDSWKNYGFFLERNSGNSKIYTNQSSVNVDVVFFNFVGSKQFDANSYEGFIQNFWQTNQNLKTLSMGTFWLNFNFTIYNSGYQYEKYLNLKNNDNNYDIEKKFYEEGRKFGTCFAKSFSTPEIPLLVLSCEGNITNTDGVFWPHCYTLTDDFIVLNSTQCNSREIMHELFHAFGIFDYYSQLADFVPVGDTDIMSHSSLPITTAFNRFVLGWLGDISSYGGTRTAIEDITEFGVYSLLPPDSPKGTIAYRFGRRGQEFFLVEVRNNSATGSSSLIVQRVNLNYSSNNWSNQPNQSTCVLYTFESEDGSKYLSGGDTLGFLNNPLYYADGTKANFSISKIGVGINGHVQFLFDEAKNKVPPPTAKSIFQTIGDALSGFFSGIIGIFKK